MIGDRQKSKEEMLNIYQELLQNNIIVESFEDKNEENMDMYNLIYNLTDKAKTRAKVIEQNVISNKEELLKTNPHTSIYKILDAINEFKN